MKGRCKKLSAIMFLILFVAGCGDKEEDGVNNLGVNGSGKDGDAKTINGIKCVLVKAGTFIMGSPTSEEGRGDEETQHEVTLTQDFWISKYPITQAQYRKFTGGGKPSYFSGDNRPVEMVYWYNADKFARSVGGRLPTEAEWEFAARGGNKSNGYIYSGSNNLGEAGWYWDNIPSQSLGNSGFGTQPVGKKQPNELGICDMSGNVREWCNDWYYPYPANAVTNPTDTNTDNVHISRVCRGGSWNDDAQYCRVAYRYCYYPSYFSPYLGFRVVFPRD